LANTIRNELPVDVIPFEETGGSLANLNRLQEGEADFALYQPGTLDGSEPHKSHTTDDVAFVANLYSQPAHFIVRRGAGIEVPDDLRGKTVQLGPLESGDYAMSKILLEHFGLDAENDFEAQDLDYEGVQQGFKDGSLDAAFITIGVNAPIFKDLFKSGKCELLSIPNAEALITKNISLYAYSIPQGLYSPQPDEEPDQDITTVAFGAQLLTHKDVDSGLVREVTRLVMSEEFLKRNNLGELYDKGHRFAQEKPEFSMHPGASKFYDPDFDIHIFESLDAIYSLVASVLIAAFLVTRASIKKQARKKEHRLDGHLRSLLDIERRQVCLDNNSEANDLETLQNLLDEVTGLRQGALEEVAAHELNEDRAIDSFIQMCHALSSKINAKISRQRLDQRFDEITKFIAQAGKDSQDIDKPK
jgi:TRAP transporter TAXI family solute receptor